MNASLSLSPPSETVFALSHVEEEKPDFTALIKEYYAALYRFALSLAQNEADAADLTQQTFYLWATKGHQLRDFSKVKSWLFTTLHRGFLHAHRHADRFPHREIHAADAELPNVASDIVEHMDSAAVMQSLMQVDELYRTPLTLFYLKEHAYHEIADILNVPIGTVMSRLSRGKQQLRQILFKTNLRANEKNVSLTS